MNHRNKKLTFHSLCISILTWISTVIKIQFLKLDSASWGYVFIDTNIKHVHTKLTSSVNLNIWTKFLNVGVWHPLISEMEFTETISTSFHLMAADSNLLDVTWLYVELSSLEHSLSKVPTRDVCKRWAKHLCLLSTWDIFSCWGCNIIFDMYRLKHYCQRYHFQVWNSEWI